MQSLLENQGARQREETGAAFETPARIAFLACVSVMGMAGLYYLALYLLTR